MGISSFCYFNPLKKIRLFFYENSEDIIQNDDKFSSICKKYDYRLIETAEPNNIKLYQKINSNQTFFVIHVLEFLNLSFFYNFFTKTQILCLANFTIGTKINPHYFGEFKSRQKNRITTFFITSTIKRNYNQLISASKKLKAENKKFHVIVIGKIKTFSSDDIPKKLKNNFTFKYNVSYSELYKNVFNSDYIIINLNPNLKEDSKFTKTRATGSAQLSYGFVKPVLIHNHFANFYNFDDSNSIIYDNCNFTKAMRNAINMSKKEYSKMKDNLLFLENQIYYESIFNLEDRLFYSQ